MTPESTSTSMIAVDPAGIEYLVRVEKAPRLGLFIATPSRWLNTLRRDRSWQLSVASAVHPWILVKERYAEHEVAVARGSELCMTIQRGEWTPPSTRPRFRYRGHQGVRFDE